MNRDLLLAYLKHFSYIIFHISFVIDWWSFARVRGCFSVVPTETTKRHEDSRITTQEETFK